MGNWKKVKFDKSDLPSGSIEDPSFCVEIHELVEGDLEDLVYSSESVPKRKKPKRKKFLEKVNDDESEQAVQYTTEKLSDEITPENAAIVNENSVKDVLKPVKKKKNKFKCDINDECSEEKIHPTKVTKNKFKKVSPAAEVAGNKRSKSSEERVNVSLVSAQQMKEATKTTKIDWTGVQDQLERSENDEKIKTTAKDVPFLDEEWTKLCGVPLDVTESLERLKFKKPTEIQKRVLPVAMDGNHDVIAAAETGSGKTLAYVIPAIRRILDSRKENPNSTGPKVLVLLPTRELAIQVSQHVKALSSAVFPKINHTTIVGGLAAHKQKRVLIKKHPEIIVATPGRLWQLINEDEIPHLRDLNQIKSLILDEADRLCEAGHFRDLQNVLNFVYKTSEREDDDESQNENQKTEVSSRQTMILSATLTVANQHLSGKSDSKTSSSHTEAIAPILNKVKLRKNYKIVDVTRSTVTAENLVEQKIFCPADEKDLYLYYCLTALPKGRKLVFANSIDHIRRLSSLFTLLRFETKVLHAHIQQRQRLKNLEKFSTSDDSTLFCTDVAARGLDIRNVNHVIHYHLPKTYETYVHRSGRTARSGCGGMSIMLMAPNEAALFVKIVNALNKEEKDIAHAEIEYKLLKNLRMRIHLAQSIEKIEHKNRKVTRENAWAAGVARDLELEFDDSQRKYAKHELSGDLTRMKSSLKKMLDTAVQTSSAGLKMKNPVLYMQ